MRRFILFITITITLLSCNNKASILNNEAKKAANQLFLELAKDPNSV